MSGSWSIEQVSDWESLWVDAGPGPISGMVPSRELPDGRKQVLDPATALLIWMLPAIHLEEINRENVVEVFIRVRMLELACGPHPDGTRYISFEDLQRRIGMNVGTGLKLGSLDELLLEHLRRRAREALEESRGEP